MRPPKTCVVLLAAVLFGFCFRLGEHQVVALPGWCTTRDCFDVYCWWPDSSSGSVLTAEDAGTPAPPPDPGTTNHTTTAIPSVLYTPLGSGGHGPRIQSGTYDQFKWPSATIMCAKIGGQWPTPQLATSPVGPSAVNTRGLTNYFCSYN